MQNGQLLFVPIVGAENTPALTPACGKSEGRCKDEMERGQSSNQMTFLTNLQV